MEQYYTRKQFDDLVEDAGVAMMTTRSKDGHLRSRAMANQKKASGADLWFVTAADSTKMDDLANDPHLNLSYYKDGSREWISVSGVAMVTKDAAKIKELYAADWKMWFADDGRENDPLAGTADDPQITLIGVRIHHASFFAIDKPAPVVLYEMAKGWITGTAPDLGHVKTMGRT
jgi:general stress protein 26